MNPIVEIKSRYAPRLKKTIITKEKINWEGVPANLKTIVRNILCYPTPEEKVLALRMLSPAFFHSELIAQLTKETRTKVSNILTRKTFKKI
jgi:hypothetical protein